MACWARMARVSLLKLSLQVYASLARRTSSWDSSTRSSLHEKTKTSLLHITDITEFLYAFWLRPGTCGDMRWISPCFINLRSFKHKDFDIILRRQPGRVSLPGFLSVWENLFNVFSVYISVVSLLWNPVCVDSLNNFKRKFKNFLSQSYLEMYGKIDWDKKIWYRYLPFN